MIAKAKRDLRQSDIKKFKLALEQGKFLAARSRPLTDKEIAELEALGNRCSDWSQISVAGDFDCSRVTQTLFEGEVNLSRFFGTVRTPEGVSVPTGIYNCTVHDSIVGNAHLNNIGLLSCTVVQQGALIRNVGSLSTTGRTTFGIGRQLSIGMEVGGRTIITYPELDLEGAAKILLNKDDEELQHNYQASVEEFREEIRSDRGFVGAETCIVNSGSLRNVWIGAGAVIDGATKLSSSSILSSLDRPTLIRDGAIVEHSLLQWGSCVESQAWVCDSLLLEASSASRHARVRYSIISSNTHLKGGEVSNSLLGPFIGLHRQAQIASVLWPQGLGSVGAGAIISGDAMGRTPDQEALLGEGITFGPRTTLLFPINLSRSPWSFISTGTTLHPQRITFPFSLIREPAPGDRTAFSESAEIFPGWALEYNTPALARAVHKFAERDQLRHTEQRPHFLTKQSTEAVLDALQQLLQIKEIRDIYSSQQIPGLGSCLLRESSRQRAIASYKLFLERYALTQAVTDLENKPELLRSGQPVAKLLFSKSPSREICRLVSIPAQLPMIIRRYRVLEKKWRDTILSTIAEGYRKGCTILDDWSETHSDPMQELRFVAEEVKESDRKVRELLAQIQAMRD